MRRLARLFAAGALLAGGLTLGAGVADAAACSGVSGVTVVIDYGSSSSTSCAPDTATAVGALKAVASVTPVPMYGDGVVCKINGVPESQTCQRMPPTSAYWAFFHAQRGGSWQYSSAGVAEYDPPAGSVIGFAFGSGGAPSTAPPAAAPKPTTSKPSTKPTPSSSTSSTPRSTSSTPAKPRATGATTPRTSVTVLPNGATTTVPVKPSTSVTKPKTAASTTTSTGSAEVVPDDGTASVGEQTGAASVASEPTSSTGSLATLLTGGALVLLVGGGAGWLALRRRSQH